MRNTVTLQLAKDILFVLSKPIPKVRLAKLMYFVFKELVRNGTYKREDLAFIRMPLGPVPFGFSKIANDDDVDVITTSVGLSYNRENYSLKKGVYLEGNHDKLAIILGKLDRYPTSSLVEISHRDSSWLNNANGVEYFIEPTDLTPIRSTSVSPITDAIDDQLIQSKLVKGMKDDIVKDNSALEYPEYYSNKNNG